MLEDFQNFREFVPRIYSFFGRLRISKNVIIVRRLRTSVRKEEVEVRQLASTRPVDFAAGINAPHCWSNEYCTSTSAHVSMQTCSAADKRPTCLPGVQTNAVRLGEFVQDRGSPFASFCQQAIQVCLFWPPSNLAKASIISCLVRVLELSSFPQLTVNPCTCIVT